MRACVPSMIHTTSCGHMLLQGGAQPAAIQSFPP